MPIHGEYRMQAANARMAQEAGVPANGIVLAENGSVVELGPNGASIVDQIEAGVTFVDGLGVGDIGDVALRDRRHMAEDGVLIVVATLAGTNGARSAAAEVIARGFAETEPLLDEMRAEAESVLPRVPRGRHRRDQAAPGAPARRHRPARLRPDAPAADDPAVVVEV